MTTVVAVVAVVVALASYVTWLAGRIDRLYARVDAAYAALDAALVRRAAAAARLAAAAGAGGLLRPAVAQAVAEAAQAALNAELAGREGVENDLTKQVQAAFPDAAPAAVDYPPLAELAAAATKVGYARQFYNDAVRDTRALRFSWLPRLLGLSRGVPLPRYFEIADPTPPTRSPLAA